MSTLTWILLATGLAGLLSVLVAASFMLLRTQYLSRVLPHLVSFATGTLLAAALLALLPHALEMTGPHGAHGIGLALVAGIGLFFILEKAVLWRHSHSAEIADHGAHHDHHHHRQEASAVLVLIGDSMHNAIDGVLIAAAFLTDIELGIVTALAALTHEIPQELGDFAVLLHSGMRRRNALLLNLLSSFAAVLGGIIGYFLLAPLREWLPYALALAAACFLYVAVADLIPGLHRQIKPRASVLQVLWIAAGVAVIAIFEGIAH
jgi:zinc and cadmium transporter